MSLLLEGEHAALATLREQFTVARVTFREMTGVGFFTRFVLPSGVPVLSPPTSFAFGDVYAELEGLRHGAGFVLFVEQGRLYMLEGYSFDEPWPDSVGSFRLCYTKGEARDWDNIHRLLEEFRAQS